MRPSSASEVLDLDERVVKVGADVSESRGHNLAGSRGEAVLASLRERCSERRWSLLAAHVRTNHVPLLVEGEARPLCQHD